MVKAEYYSSFENGVDYLENKMLCKPDKIKEHINKIKSKIEKLNERKLQLGNSAEDKLESQQILSEKLSLEYFVERIWDKVYSNSETISCYLLKQARPNSKAVELFIKTTNAEKFWDESDFYENPHSLWYLNSINSNNAFLSETIKRIILNSQNTEGYIRSNEGDHTGSLRVLLATMPNSQATKSALQHWLKNWLDFSDEPQSLAIGILALTECDWDYYNGYITKMADTLKKLQETDGFWKHHLNEIELTSLSVAAISRAYGPEDMQAQKGLEWLTKEQEKLIKKIVEKSNSDYVDFFSHNQIGWILYALSSMGYGQQISKENNENKIMRLKQNHLRAQPIFLHTSPLYQSCSHVKGLYDNLTRMIQSAEFELLISSPFIDMLYEDIINRIQANPNLIVKVITRPRSEIKGLRAKIASNVVDLLNTATKGNVIQSLSVHSRMVIVDRKEVLVSSADLTRDQLFDEFNAGIYTTDQETINRAVAYFDNIFKIEQNEVNQS